MAAKKKHKVNAEPSPETDRETTAERESDSMRHFDKEYTANYRKWRQDNKGSFGFFYRDNRNEYTYQDGYGFVRDIPESMEAHAMGHVNSIAGYILLACAVMNMLFHYIVPLILNGKFGVPIGMIRLSGGFYGDEKVALIYSYIVQIFIRIVPVLAVVWVSKMPLRVMLPTKISNRPLFRISVPAALMTGAVSIVLSVPYYAILRALGVNINRASYIPEGNVNIVLMFLLNVVLLPILNEIITRGAFMQLLRQFGDGYALMATGFITAVMSGDIRMFPLCFFYSVVIGYFVLRTGSVITAFIMRVTLAAFYWFLSFFMNRVSSNIISVHNAFMLLCFAVGLYFVIHFVMHYSDKTELPIKKTFLTPYEKLMNFFACPPVILWVSLALAVMLLSIPTRI